MNREIKFRAFNPATKDMLYSDEAPEEPQRLGNFFWGISAAPSSIIMQFTGLFDNKGKEIYEGDIVDNWQGGWNVVVYKAPFFEATVSVDQSSLYSREWWDRVKVIGNIYDNPDTRPTSSTGINNRSS